MRLVIASVGRFRGGPLQELYSEYAGRLPWPIDLKEVEEKRPLKGKARMTREAELLRGAIPEGATVIALDEKGKSMNSQDFAQMLGRFADDGVQTIAFLIGGADGHTQETLGKADRLLSLGPMTWPHLMVRGLLAEQLYRASSILSNHPYHRA
ncbi:MAG: 23S rRNA (pseudouridine(1915)-N(3))-methyltransferase RlmH [Sneathiella sp.]|jgi:23S rRNA (pseudouridine1915-N3)-methyltransferase|uniref:23S rRNA (pseudouridine(1915)-N(3))-methyltransferase RlmH n=1 Tax=Sneathiella sp. TaxID=1964365 RepID=UPI000C676D34|nr:23S rRNA (pseudouridine(1915)-N(3))-methyltransferase RlmH [Sneathiella sp.]MAL78931.1 23S rRNA (pseudouridine(1915)-N(3))-methyltransferase RlmH [Sneathiella sp.]|tara:strand:+ start:237 stop:695 length:459 start_codon:yes stop_codon:yes gene_type:complete